MTAATTLEDAYGAAEAVVRRSGTSFGPGMRILSKPRRDAMHAVYAFCREVDDIADEEGALDAKLRGLDLWREEVERIRAGGPRAPLGVALADACGRFDLPLAELHAMIDGMETDARGGLLAPSLAELRLYCRRVAGSVGLMSVRVFGAPDEAARRFALALADAFQLTNILRDVHEDAARGRIYVPAEAFRAAGVRTDADPAALIGHPGLERALAHLAREAGAAWDRSAEILRLRGAKGLRPALMMAGVYRSYFERLEKRGWRDHRREVALGKAGKIVAALMGAVGSLKPVNGGAR